MAPFTASKIDASNVYRNTHTTSDFYITVLIIYSLPEWGWHQLVYSGQGCKILILICHFGFGRWALSKPNLEPTWLNKPLSFHPPESNNLSINLLGDIGATLFECLFEHLCFCAPQDWFFCLVKQISKQSVLVTYNTLRSLSFLLSRFWRWRLVKKYLRL